MTNPKKWILSLGLLVSLPFSVCADDGGHFGKGSEGDTPPGFDGGNPPTGHGIIMRSQLSLPSIGATGLGSAIWGWTDRTDPRGPQEYALFGVNNGTSFINVTNPDVPVYVGRLPSATGSSAWRELKTRGNHAFIVSDGNGAHGMQVFDLTQLRTYAGTPITFSTAPSSFYTRYTGVTNTHTIFINESTPYAYLFGSNTFAGGAHIVNISNPMSPTFQAGFTPPAIGSSSYIHDGQVVIYNGPDATYQGREILFAANARGTGNTNDDTVSIIDVTNKAAINQVGAATHPNARYIHQGWLTPDQRYFLVNDELDEYYNQRLMTTHVYDVSDLDAPIYKGGWQHPVNSLNIDHNLFIKDDPIWGTLVFSSDYTLGLRVIQLNDLTGANPQMTELGWFDTYPADDGIQNFNGQWGNYPFFDSGIIIAGDRQNGLFVLQLDFSSVPEPSTWALIGITAAGGVGFEIRRRRNRRSRVADQDVEPVID